MNNPPAFPCGEYRVPFQGMTMRDYFAAKAMQNMDWKTNPYNNLQTNANTCYAIADAMLKAREA